MKDFSFSEIKNVLRLPEGFELPVANWRPIDSFYNELPEYFLSRSKLIEILKLFDITEELLEAIVEKLVEIKNDRYWRTFLYHLYDIMFLEDRSLKKGESHPRNIVRIQSIINSWPRLTGVLGENSSLFYVFPYLYRVPDVLAMYREKGLPENVALTTLKDLFLWIHEYRRQYGEWGVMELGWFMLHFNLRLFQLGRLQFELARFDYDFHVFENRETGEILMLTGDGMKFRADGQFFDADRTLESNYWEACYEDTGGEYIGNIIEKRGVAAKKIVKLSKDKWVEVLKRGDDALGVHIPAGGSPPGHGPMDKKRCNESFMMAKDFFSRHFSMMRFKFFTCTSWMLDPQLKMYLKSDSNIVIFQERFYLHPVPGADDKQIYQRVFSYDESVWTSAPALTSLQKIVRKHEANGGRWRMGGGITPI